MHHHFVIPVKAGIPGQQGAALHAGTLAVARVTVKP